MSLVLLGILNQQLAGGAAIAYQLQTLGGASSDEGLGIALDSAGNIYTVGKTSSAGAGSGDILLVKYDASGAVAWQRTLGSAETEEGYGIAVTPAGDVYVSGVQFALGGGDFAILAKYNTSGTIQWQRTLSKTAPANLEFNGLALDSSGNVYAVGTNTIGSLDSDRDLIIAKYDSSGTIQWQRELGSTSNDEGFGIHVDSSDNVYITGGSFSGSSTIFTAKYNSGGTLQWQRNYGLNSQFNEGRGIASDASGNVYVAGICADTRMSLIKYDSSGNLQWQREQRSGSNSFGYSVAVDSTGNIYALGETNASGVSGSYDFLIVKYDSSGNIQWQRFLGGSGSERGTAIAFDSADNMFLFGRTATTGEGGNDEFLAVLPNDGSLTGTYVLDGVNIIYKAGTMSPTNSSFSSATSSLTSSTSTLTSSTSSYTSSTASLTAHRTDI